MIDKKILGDRIRQIRQRKGISQGKLGVELSKTHASISDIELGKTELSVTDLAKIASYFEVSISELVGEPKNDVQYMQFRDKKDITLDEKQYADKITKDFIELARALADKKVNEESK